VRACAIGKPNVSTQQIFDLESDFGKGSDGERVAAAQRKTGLFRRGISARRGKSAAKATMNSPNRRKRAISRASHTFGRLCTRSHIANTRSVFALWVNTRCTELNSDAP